MKKIKRLYIFDMDGTLLDTPLKDDGMIKYKAITGKDYPHLGWWGRRESLMLEYDIKPRLDVYNEYLLAKDDNEAVTVLLTNRMKKLQGEIAAVLEHLGISLDVCSYKYDNRNKAERAFEIAKGYPDLETIYFWDDMEEHITHFDTHDFGTDVKVITKLVE